MKKSKSIRLVLIGGLSAGAFHGCTPAAPTDGPAPLLIGGAYTNDHYGPGAGYYHAPYRAWFPRPYNQFDLQTKMYFHGGRWTPEPHLSITNISTPVENAFAVARAAHSPVQRGGFGNTGIRRSTWS